MPFKDHAKREEWRKQYQQEHRYERLAYNRKWRIDNQGKYRESIKRCAINRPEQYKAINRNAALQSNYGITLNEYNRMFQIQGGMCAICKRHQSEFKKALHVDHNHKTGKVRSLLCAKCNVLVGVVEIHSEKMLAYIKSHE